MQKPMSLKDNPTKKVCPKCKQTDVTRFSKCKNCGTRYDAIPQEKPSNINYTWPGVLLFFTLLIAYSVYTWGQVAHMQGVYSHIEKLVGQSLNCRSAFALVSASQQNLRSFDAELAVAEKDDPKNYGSRGAGGIMTMTAALNSMASGKEGSGGVIYRYAEDGRIDIATSDGQVPLAVEVLAATSSSDKYPMVRVKLLNGPKSGSVWWMNVDQLDLSSK
jgi:hypothetical protein